MRTDMPGDMPGQTCQALHHSTRQAQTASRGIPARVNGVARHQFSPESHRSPLPFWLTSGTTQTSSGNGSSVEGYQPRITRITRMEANAMS